MNSDVAQVAEQRRALVGRLQQLVVDALQLDLEPDEIHEDSPLFGYGLGLDSIDALTLVVAVEAEFDVEVSEEDMHAFHSVNAIADHVLAR